MLVDLHIHTAASGDGEFSPEEIIQFAKSNQLKAIAITDHDSVDSIASALREGEKQGIEVIPGCEFSTRYKQTWLHVLGYFIDYTHPDIKVWYNQFEKGRSENIDVQIDKLRESGFYLDKKTVMESGTQPMPLAYSQAIFTDYRNNSNPVINQYRSQENYMVKFCMDWMASGRPCNAPIHLPNVTEAIRLIKKCGGVSVLAHPAATLGFEHDVVIDELLEFGLMGVEAFTTWHSKEQEDYYFQYCQRRGIIATCGSDFHGKTKPHIRLGQVRNNDYRVVEVLKSLRV